jgi:non-ribosomal peptide synthetase component F
LPKGTVVEHQAFASSCLQFGPAFGIDEDTRALQFASYAFGACLVEILTVLMLGGCVCISSEQDRSDAIEDFMCRFGVNWAVFTPAFVRVIRPGKVPNLRTLNLGGEPVTKVVRDIWAAHARIVFVYGQSETSTCCISTDITASTTDFRNIGRPVSARDWITEVDDVNRLAPVGCTGELIIESWGVARGYLKANELQSSAFLDRTPDWYPAAAEPNASPPPRMYRTGDLVRYAPDGCLIRLGRKDQQAKIRGQKVLTMLRPS